jgi:biopolymer transport protein ExbD
MGRFRQATSESDETSVDISPLIDCVFILLIFFIVTTTFVEETGVEVDKPQAAAALQLEKQSIFIAITEDGDVVYAGRNIGVAGVQREVKKALQAEDVPVIIEADRVAKSGLMVEVIGEAKLAGATKVSIATRKQR